MAVLNINSEDLIALVQERGIIWDKPIEEYKNKHLKLAAWREICSLLVPDFEKLDEKERHKYGKLVVTKWTNLRDAWMRANKNEVQKSGAGAKTNKPYIYKEQMQFLKKIAEPNRTHDSVSERPTDVYSETGKSTDTNPEESLSSARRKRKLTDLDEKMCQFLDSRMSTDQGKDTKDHPMLSFFKGILPSVVSFDDDEILELQSGVLSLIQNIKKKRQNRVSSSNYSWQLQAREYMRAGYLSQSQNINPPGQQNTQSSASYGYSIGAVEPASPASNWSQHSQDSDFDFSQI
ncbi:uncharacterized protein LOC134795012 [Cydia splendana]|uniref:uncharacterized protein LOC134795012 n=1 Tax=Cydia splendana TaxID=1100963 RepID=UPI00300C87E0